METQIKGTGLAITPDVRSYLDKKISSFAKMLSGDTAVRIDIEIGKTTKHHQTGDVFRAEFNLRTSAGYFRTIAEEASVFAAIDMAEEKLLQEVRHRKHREQSVIRRTGARIKEAMRRFGNWR